MVNAGRLIRYVNRAPELYLASKRTPAYGQLFMRYLDIGSGRYPFEVPLKRGGSLTLAGSAIKDCVGVRSAECLRRFNIDMLDMLKMDIEGSEWSVLLSTSPAVLKRIRYIQLEYHEVAARFGYTPERLFSRLANAGHRLTFRSEDQYHTGMAIFEGQ